jgi:putative intracellular protease/amidase
MVKVLLGSTSATALPNGHPTGVWLEEVSSPYWVFTDAGFEVEIASVLGGVVTVDAGSRSPDNVPDNRFVDAGKLDLFQSTKAFADVNAGDYDAIFLAGGHGTCVDYEDGCKDVVERFWNAGKVVSAVCHGPTGLVKAEVGGKRLLEGKNCTGFSDNEEQICGLQGVVASLAGLMKAAGGLFVEAPAPWEAHVVVDGKLVTGQNPQSSTVTAEAVRDLLKN